MTVWFTSDLHLGHAKVIEYAKRPYRSADEMDRDLIRRWNNSVKPGDTIYALGDMGSTPARVGVPLLKRLNGTKFLIQGNHDLYSPTQYRDAGFSGVFQEALITLFGKRLRLSHYPYWPEEPEKEPKHELRYPERRPKPAPDEYLLCGHVHLLWKQLGRQINVGVDQWKYAPVSQSVIEGLLSKIDASS